MRREQALPGGDTQQKTPSHSEYTAFSSSSSSVSFSCCHYKNRPKATTEEKEEEKQRWIRKRKTEENVNSIALTWCNGSYTQRSPQERNPWTPHSSLLSSRCLAALLLAPPHIHLLLLYPPFFSSHHEKFMLQVTTSNLFEDGHRSTSL